MYMPPAELNDKHTIYTISPRKYFMRSGRWPSNTPTLARDQSQCSVHTAPGTHIYIIIIEMYFWVEQEKENIKNSTLPVREQTNAASHRVNWSDFTVCGKGKWFNFRYLNATNKKKWHDSMWHLPKNSDSIRPNGIWNA